MKIKFNDLRAMLRATDLLDLFPSEMNNINIIFDQEDEKHRERVMMLLNEIANINRTVSNFGASKEVAKSALLQILDEKSPKPLIIDYTDLMHPSTHKVEKVALDALKDLADITPPPEKNMDVYLAGYKVNVIKKRPHKKAKTNGKYLTFVRRVYNEFQNGIGYMDAVELLCDGTIGQWGVEQRKNCRGYGSTNLCGTVPLSRLPMYLNSKYNHKVGILNAWFVKKDRKYYPNEKLRAHIMSDEFKPFADQNYRKLKSLGLYDE